MPPPTPSSRCPPRARAARSPTSCNSAALCRALPSAGAATTRSAAITGAVIGTHSGDDNGASSTGYTGMLLAIGMLADRLVGERARRPMGRLPAASRRAAAPMVVAEAGQAADLLADRTAIDLVGAGAAFATAGEGAMLIREAVRIPAAGWDTLNYLHGPMESQDARTGLIAFGDGREVKIAEDVAGFGCPSVLITNAHRHRRHRPARGASPCRPPATTLPTPS